LWLGFFVNKNVEPSGFVDVDRDWWVETRTSVRFDCSVKDSFNVQIFGVAIENIAGESLPLLVIEAQNGLIHGSWSGTGPHLLDGNRAPEELLRERKCVKHLFLTMGWGFLRGGNTLPFRRV